MKTRVLLGFLAAAALMASGAVQAETWTTVNSTNTDSDGNTPWPNTGDPLYFYGSEGTRVRIDAFQIDKTYLYSNNQSQWHNPAAGDGSVVNPTNPDDVVAIAWGSGIGVQDTGATGDFHTLGNNGAKTDAILLDFGDAIVSLEEVVLASKKGWSGDDARDQDFELYARTSDTGNAGVPGSAYGSWADDGWELVLAQNGDPAQNYDKLVMPYPVAKERWSSQWIVLAADHSNSSMPDAFKYKGFTASIQNGGGGEAPAPGTLALLGIGAIAARRWRKRAG